MLHCYLIDRAPHVTGTTISGVSNYIVTSSRLQKIIKEIQGGKLKQFNKTHILKIMTISD